MLDARKEDLKLTKLLLRGRKSAWNTFYETYAAPLHRFVHARLYGDRSGAEELSREALAVCVEQIDRFDASRGSLWSWLCGIAVNQIGDAGRMAALQKKTLKELAQGLSLVCQDPDPDAADREGPPVDLVLSALNPRHQHVLRAKYLDGLSVRDIAKALSVSEKTVESRLTRSREAFRREYEKHNTMENES